MESFVNTLIGNALAATVLALVAVALGRTCRRPAVTHSLWLLVMLKLITPALVPISLPIAQLIKPTETHAAASTHVDREPAEALVNEAPQELGAMANRPLAAGPLSSEARALLAEIVPDRSVADGEPRSVDPSDEPTSMVISLTTRRSWERPLLALILSGALGFWSLAAVRIVRFQRELHGVPLASEEWQCRTAQLASQLGLARCPPLYLVPGRVPPMLWAIIGRPRLLLPVGLWSALSAEGRTSLLLHELAHLKRRDHWVRWLELIVAGLYWWHPVVWWARRALREAEEQCCDAWVVWAMPQRARTYAASLLAAIDFMSGAQTAPAVASAIGANGHVPCLKRRLRMIVRAKTPKGLSWAGRIAVLGMAALLLPLAPNWARANVVDQPPAEQQGITDISRSQHDLELAREQYRAAASAGQAESPSKRAKKPADKADQLLARLTQDDDKKGEIEEKARKTAEQFAEQIKDLLEKLGKELGPVGEEVRKALERAVGEVHESLTKEDFSGEEFGKALEKSVEEVRKAFEGGGPVDRQLREAIDRSRDEVQKALNRARETAQDQVEALRERSRDLRDKAEADRDRAKDEVERGAARDDEEPVNRQELETARREIRDLEAQLRRATRRLDEIQRRAARRSAAPRRDTAPRPEAPPQAPIAPRAEPVEPRPPREPVAPASPARPVPPGVRRGLPPARLGPGGVRRGPQADRDRRLQELEDTMKRLLKELENLKEEKKSSAEDRSSSPDARPARPGKLIVS